MRQYYNPDLSADEVRRLDWENHTVLMAGQALLGAITPNMIAILIETEFEASIRLVFVLRHETVLERSEIAEVAAGLGALLADGIDVRTTVTIDPAFHLGGEARSLRTLFMRARPEREAATDPPSCRRCARPVVANAAFFETFEGMHWTCFHYEFEHDAWDGVVDPDKSCQ